MSTNTYGRMQTSLPMSSNTGATTSYGGGYGHGSHGGHGSHTLHGTSHTTAQNDSNYVNNIQPEDYLGKFRFKISMLNSSCYLFNS